MRSSMVALRPPQPDDLELLFGWSQDRLVARRWCFYHRLPSRDEFAQDFFAGVLTHAIIESRDGVPIGYAMAYNADFRSEVCSMGSVIGPTCIAPGMVTLGSVRFLDGLFRDYNFRQIYLEVYGHNQPVADALRRRGGQLEAVLQDDLFLDGQFHDLQIFVVTRETWLERRRPAWRPPA